MSCELEFKVSVAFDDDGKALEWVPRGVNVDSAVGCGGVWDEESPVVVAVGCVEGNNVDFLGRHVTVKMKMGVCWRSYAGTNCLLYEMMRGTISI